LGVIGTGLSLPSVLLQLQDPFARAEAAEAASLIAQRTGSVAATLAELQEPGLGSTWRWSARARLGDGIWAEALLGAWASLSAPQRIQALESARFLPGALRQQVKAGTADAQRSGGNLRQAWESL